MNPQSTHTLDLAFVARTMPDGCTELLVTCLCPACVTRRGELLSSPHPTSAALVLALNEQDGPWHD